ncbi:YfjI family protein [Enterobacter sp. PTB]|uniref:YfjI family protein n=1 Tax=Enterobacter sp. PTB TaxID=3143437 RepID=UPI003DA96A50
MSNLDFKKHNIELAQQLFRPSNKDKDNSQQHDQYVESDNLSEISEDAKRSNDQPFRQVPFPAKDQSIPINSLTAYSHQIIATPCINYVIRKNAEQSEPYPVSAFPPSLQRVIRYVHDETKASDALIGSVVLTAISLACQRFIQVDVPRYGPCNCSLYLLTISDSGEGKGAVTKKIMSPFIIADKEMESKYESENQKYDLQIEINKIIKKELKGTITKKRRMNECYDAESKELEDMLIYEKKKPVRNRVFYGNADATISGIQDYLAQSSKSAGLIYNEAVLFFNAKAKHSFGFLTTMWDGSDAEIIRKNSHTLITDTKLTMSLMIQSHVWESYLSRNSVEARSSGFLARFLISKPEPTAGSRFDNGVASDPVALHEFHARISHLLNEQTQHSDIITLKLSDESVRKMLDYKNNIESRLAPDGELKGITDFASRHIENIYRTAALLHFFCHRSDGEIISDVVIEQACEINTYYLSQTKMIPSLNIKTPRDDANDLLGWMAKMPTGHVFTLSDLRNNAIPTSLRNKDRIMLALERLNKEGVISTFESINGKNGKKGTNIYINKNVNIHYEQQGSISTATERKLTTNSEEQDSCLQWITDNINMYKK